MDTKCRQKEFILAIGIKDVLLFLLSDTLAERLIKPMFICLAIILVVILYTITKKKKKISWIHISFNSGKKMTKNINFVGK